MTDLDYQALKKKTLSDLREMGGQYTEGVALLKKEQLIELLCKELGIKTALHAEGIDVSVVKRQIRALKVERQSALEAKDAKELKQKRRMIRALKRRIRKVAVETARHAPH